MAGRWPISVIWLITTCLSAQVTSQNARPPINMPARTSTEFCAREVVLKCFVRAKAIPSLTCGSDEKIPIFRFGVNITSNRESCQRNTKLVDILVKEPRNWVVQYHLRKVCATFRDVYSCFLADWDRCKEELNKPELFMYTEYNRYLCETPTWEIYAEFRTCVWNQSPGWNATCAAVATSYGLAQGTAFRITVDTVHSKCEFFKAMLGCRIKEMRGLACDGTPETYIVDMAKLNNEAAQQRCTLFSTANEYVSFYENFDPDAVPEEPTSSTTTTMTRTTELFTDEVTQDTVTKAPPPVARQDPVDYTDSTVAPLISAFTLLYSMS